MYCKNCGAEMSEGQELCPVCGTINDVEPVNSPKNGLPIIPIAIGAAVVLVLLIILVFGNKVNHNSYKSIAKAYIESQHSGDGKTLVKLYHKNVIKEIMEDGDYDSKKDLIEEFEDDFEELKEKYADEYGKNWKLTYEMEFEDNDDDDHEDFIEYVTDRYEDEYDLKIKDAKYVEYECKIKGKDGKDRFTRSAVLVKIGGKWYIAG